MSSIQLTPGQKRRLYATLLAFEQALRLVEHLLKDEEETGILFYRKRRLSDRQHRVAGEQIEDALQELADFTVALGLEPKEEFAARTIASFLGESWAGLEDCRSQSL
jgi:hypothetical protein